MPYILDFMDTVNSNQQSEYKLAICTFLIKNQNQKGKDSIPLQQCCVLQEKNNNNTDLKSTDNFQGSSIQEKCLSATAYLVKL